MDDLSGMHASVAKLEAEKRAAGGKVKAKPADVGPRPDDNTKALRKLVDRIVDLEEQKRELSADIKAVYEAVKNTDYSPKSVRIIVKREMETADQAAARRAVEAEVQTLAEALGAFAHTPLGEAALAAQ